MFSLKLYLYIFYKLYFAIHIQHVNGENKIVWAIVSHTCHTIQGGQFRLLGLHSHACFPALGMLQMSLILLFLVSCLFHHRTHSQIPKNQNTKNK